MLLSAGLTVWCRIKPIQTVMIFLEEKILFLRLRQKQRIRFRGTVWEFVTTPCKGAVNVFSGIYHYGKSRYYGRASTAAGKTSMGILMTSECIVSFNKGLYSLSGFWFYLCAKTCYKQNMLTPKYEPNRPQWQTINVLEMITHTRHNKCTVGNVTVTMVRVKPGFHYPSWRVTGFHYPSTRPVLTGNGNRSPVNSDSVNRA